MKLTGFDDRRLGVVNGDRIVDVTAAVQDIAHTGPGDLMNGLIARWSERRAAGEQAASAGKGVALSQARLRRRTGARDTRLDRERKGLEGPTPQLTGKYAKP